MQLRRTITAIFTVLLAGAVHAGGDLSAGKTQYETTCAACHGRSGEGNAALHAPRLTHLTVVYIVQQLQKLQQGQRGGEGAGESARQMAAIATTLIDEQAMIDVAAYIVTLKGGPSAATLSGDATLGADYFNQLCGACHGARAQGNVALRSPPLAGADDWYLAAQLRAFRSGQRGAHPDDRTGRQMRAMAALLPDEQAISDVVTFVHGLRP